LFGNPETVATTVAATQETQTPATTETATAGQYGIHVAILYTTLICEHGLVLG